MVNALSTHRMVRLLPTSARTALGEDLGIQLAGTRAEVAHLTLELLLLPAERVELLP